MSDSVFNNSSPPSTAANRKKNIIFLCLTLPMVVLWNTMIFGGRYYTEWQVFLGSSLIVFALTTFTWQINAAVVRLLNKRFTDSKDIFKKLSLTILIFFIVCGLSLTWLFRGYNYYNFLGYEINETMYQWSLLLAAILVVFIAFLHQGVSGFDKWKRTIRETEQLKKEYMQSQLLGLKSQVNPHYLFNSLNSLSSLISEDQEEAEKFLNEMSKVYRYLLRNSGEQMVALEIELRFIQSYFHLLKVRHREGVELLVNVNSEDAMKFIPPLTLQIILENIFNLNVINKDTPLVIEIISGSHGRLTVKNSIQYKGSMDRMMIDMGLENISNKFKLLCQQSLEIRIDGGERTISLPLIHSSA